MLPSPPTASGRSPQPCEVCGAPTVLGQASGRCPTCEVVPRGGQVVIRPVRGRWVGLATWSHAAVVLAALGLIRLAGNQWWPATLLMFSPRWLLLAPTLPLLLAGLCAGGRRYYVVQLATFLVVAGPLMRVNLPVDRMIGPPPTGERLRVVTCNLGTSQVDLPRLRAWIEARDVAVVCFQEGRGRRGPRFLEEMGPGWHYTQAREIASRYPILEELAPTSSVPASNGRDAAILASARIRTPSGREVVVSSVHLPTIRPGREGFGGERTGSTEEKMARWEAQTRWMLDQVARTYEFPTIVAGDFNMPSDSPTMIALRGSLRFAFEEAGWGYGYTRPTLCPWMRIDHILTGPDWQVVSCRVGPDFGSDHLPLLAELVLTTGPPPRD